MELWLPKQYQRFWHQKVPTHFMSGEFSKIRHLCDMFSKTNPKQFYLSGFGSAFPDEGRGGGFWLLQKWDAIDNLRTSSSPNWWFDSSWFLPFGRKKTSKNFKYIRKACDTRCDKKLKAPTSSKTLCCKHHVVFLRNGDLPKGSRIDRDLEEEVAYYQIGKVAKNMM